MQSEALYDHGNDSQELHNLSSYVKYTEAVARMNALLKQAHPVPVQGGMADPDLRKKYCN